MTKVYFEDMNHTDRITKVSSQIYRSSPNKCLQPYLISQNQELEFAYTHISK